MLKQGDRLPELELPDETGKERSFEDLARRKGLVIYVYPKDSTPGCTLEAQEFSEQLPAFRRLGWEVVGLSRDSVKSHCGFIEKQGLSVSLLSDPDGAFIRALGAWGPKKMGGKEYEGILRTTFVVGADKAILKVYPAVKASGHAQAVLADLRGS
ncbi:MAG: peroxiredoxin [Polyangia bacterium]|nr:peroxiredoxin [Polyangia bacterium]